MSSGNSETQNLQRKMRLRKKITVLLLILSIMGAGYYYSNQHPRLRAFFFRLFCAVKMDRILAPNKFIAIHDPGCIKITNVQGSIDPIIGIIVGSEARAYTLKEAIWHHIIHDSIGGKSVLITYCNLTFTPIVYDLSGFPEKRFTVHGLHENNMIMKECGTGDLWLQATGMWFDGKGKEGLPRLPSYLTTVQAWARLFPDSKIFVGDTKCRHPRDCYPHHSQYLEYFHTDIVALPLSNPDHKQVLHPKEIVTGLFVDGRHYTLVNRDFFNRTAVHVSLPAHEVVVFYKNTFESLSVYEPNGRRFIEEKGIILDRETGSEWNMFGEAIRGTAKGTHLLAVDSLTAFWFAWNNHFPGGNLIRVPSEERK